MVSIGTVAGYSHVAVEVTDLERSREFYRETLGLEELPRPDLGGNAADGAWFRVGDAQLHLIRNASVMRRESGLTPHIALYVPTAAFAATVDALRATDTPLRREPRQRPGDGIWAAFFEDPDGNLIELTNLGHQG